MRAGLKLLACASRFIT